MKYAKDVAQETNQFRVRFEVATGLTVHSVNYRGSGGWEVHYSAPLADTQITALAFQRIRLKAHRQSRLGDGTAVARFEF